MMESTGRAARLKSRSRRAYLAFSLSACVAAVSIFVFSQFRLNGESVVRNNPLFLLLCAVLGCVLLAPAVYLVPRGRLDLFHPLVYPVVLYLFPVFVIGSLTLATPMPPSWIVSYVYDPNYYLNLALVYIIVGFLSLNLGFALPVASRLGQAVANHIPDWKWSASAVRLPSLVLLGIGTVATFYGYAQGVLGYQVLETPLLTGGTISTFTLLSTLGAFMLWHSYFRRDRSKREVWTPILILLVVQVLISSALSGSRYTLLSGTLTIFAAYHFAGGRLRKRTLVPVGIVGVLAILLGFALGTAFRDIKGSENAVPLQETIDVAGLTVNQMATIGAGGTLELGVGAFLQRIENLSSFAVIVGNYERLRPLEEQYGIAGNIWTYTWTAFIPRFLWPEKPLISDARAIGALYFNFPTNSFAMTVFGDLLRNFGPIGIPLGMLFLGFLLRVLWSALITPMPVSAWPAATYYLLLTSVNYESFYGTIIPAWVRIAFVCLVGGLFANALSGASRRASRTASFARSVPS